MKGNIIMNTMNTISYLEAVNAVLKETGLTPAQARFAQIDREDDMYRLFFRTDWMKYEAYVSALSGEVLGVDMEPAVDEGYAEPAYTFLRPQVSLAA